MMPSPLFRKALPKRSRPCLEPLVIRGIDLQALSGILSRRSFPAKAGSVGGAVLEGSLAALAEHILGGRCHLLNRKVPGVGEAVGERDDLRVLGDLKDLSHERFIGVPHPVCELMWHSYSIILCIAYFSLWIKLFLQSFRV